MTLGSGRHIKFLANQGRFERYFNGIRTDREISCYLHVPGWKIRKRNLDAGVHEQLTNPSIVVQSAWHCGNWTALNLRATMSEIQEFGHPRNGGRTNESNRSGSSQKKTANRKRNHGSAVIRRNAWHPPVSAREMPGVSKCVDRVVLRAEFADTRCPCSQVPEGLAGDRILRDIAGNLPRLN
jgi:hypothetical protein